MTLFVVGSVEFYVIAVVIAAAVIALCIRPSRGAEARQYLLAGVLCDSTDDASSEPYIAVECLDDGNVLLRRGGLTGMTDGGAVSLAVTVAGFDIRVEERIVRTTDGLPVNTALFTLDFLASERYHLHYNSEPTATAASMTLSNRPGMSLRRQLKLNS